MRSDRNLDLYRHSPARLAAAHREQAAMWLVNPYYKPDERQRRHDDEIEKAERLEQKDKSA